MSGQHVGGLSDSIKEDGRTAAREQMRRVMKPQGRRFTGTSQLGNGEVCPLDASHGRMFNMPSGRDWCPHSDHTKDVGRLTPAAKVVPELPELELGELNG